MYKPVTEFPKLCSYEKLRHENIGVVTGIYKSVNGIHYQVLTIAMTEPDAKQAKEKFTEVMKKKIEYCESDIQYQKLEIEKHKKTLEVIEDYNAKND